MTPRTEKPNRFKREAQERKAEKLSGAIRELAAKCGLTALEVFGRLGRADWLMLGVITGQKKPSVPSRETQALILGKLRGEHREMAS